MGRLGNTLLIAVLVSAFCATVTSTVAAHGGGPVVEIIPTEALAGDPVLIYGENLDPGAAVRVALSVAAGEHVLGSFECDGDGHLVAEVVLPTGLEPRAYEIRLTTDRGIVVTSLITVVGAEPARAGNAPSLVGALALAVGAMIIAGLLVIRRRPGEE
jgi:hypothetical protein